MDEQRVGEDPIGQAVADAPGMGRVLEGEFPDVQGALLGCAEVQDMLASIYFKPLSEEQVESFAELDTTAMQGMNEQADHGLHEMKRSLAKRTTATRRDLAVDFTAAFAGTSTWQGRSAVPYESVFTSPEGLLYQDSYHEVYQLFRANGVERSEGYDYPDDHLSFMLEFLALECHRAQEALAVGDCAGALSHVNLSDSFAKDHVLSWFGEFRELAEKMLETRFYKGVLEFTEGFLAFFIQVLCEIVDVLGADAAEDD